MKIIQISTCSPQTGVTEAYGLGDDGLLYMWNWKERRWVESYAI